MRSDEEHQQVLALVETGLSDRQVARRTGISRLTIGNWRRGGEQPRRAGGDPDWRPRCAPTYCYLLGLYLGDGHIVRCGRGAWMRVTLDAKHGGVATEAERALSTVFPDAHIGRYEHPTIRKIDLQVSDRSLPYAFPQSGPGRKHKRPIGLVQWQLELTTRHPEELIRGLIHSDGCRTINRFTRELPSGRVAHYEYPRYFFSNLSEDIRQIFCEHCDLLRIRWTQSSSRNISIAHRASVARMDSFVGPKS
jgi:Homeodomain-like domain